MTRLIFLFFFLSKNGQTKNVTQIITFNIDIILAIQLTEKRNKHLSLVPFVQLTMHHT